MRHFKARHLLPTSLFFRINLWVMLFVAILFVAAFSLMLYQARKAIREESLGKAADMLEQFQTIATNTLREKEVIATQTHWQVEQNLSNPAQIDTYLQQILHNEPSIIGVAAAFQPGYYPQHPGDYMIYYHRQGNNIVSNQQFAGETYRLQPWYANTISRNRSQWSEPADEYRTDGQPIITYALPLRQEGRPIGVFAIDISLRWLTGIIQAHHLTPSAYSAVLTRSGAFIIHPDTTMLRPRAIFQILNHNPEGPAAYTAYRMLAGQTGWAQMPYRGQQSLIVFKPIPGTPWIIDTVSPLSEVMFNSKHMLPLMITLMVIALLAVLTFCSLFIRRELTPLKTLEASAQQITDGHYDMLIPTVPRPDEVGSLTASFIAMRRSIMRHINRIKRTKRKLMKQNHELTATHHRIQEDLQVKADFLQNMTDQMSQPVNELLRLVSHITSNHRHMSHDEITQMATQVDHHTQTITTLLDTVLQVSTHKQKKEGCL